MKPLVSFCIPNYNNAAYITKAVTSVQRQTIQDFEIIICDNQSTDDSVQMMAELAQSDSRIKYYVNDDNYGIYGNYVRVTEKATGQYIKFLNADDWLHPEYTSHALDYFQQYPEIALVTCDMAVVTNDGIIKQVRRGPNPPQEYFDFESLVENSIKRMNPIGNPTQVIVKRSVFEELGGFDPDNEFSGDFDLWLRIASHAPIIAIPEILCYERNHPQQRTHIHRKQGDMTHYICMALEKSIRDNPTVWTLERRIAFAHHALSPYIRTGIEARWQGKNTIWENIHTAISKVCPPEHWEDYHERTAPKEIYKHRLLRLLKPLKDRLVGKTKANGYANPT